MDDFEYDSIDYNDITRILNELFDFKNKNMPEDSLLDTIFEFANKYNYNPIQLAEELSEAQGFKDIVQNDCIKFKYYRKVDSSVDTEWC